jgi:TPR repeat protein
MLTGMEARTETRILMRVFVVGTLAAASGLVCPVAAQTPPADISALVSHAEAGDAQAQCELGTYYSEGPAKDRDFARAREWLRKAAEQGHAEAQRRLGRLYAFLDPSSCDPAQAAHWYALAADQGDVVAQRPGNVPGLVGIPRPHVDDHGLAALAHRERVGG